MTRLKLSAAVIAACVALAFPVFAQEKPAPPKEGEIPPPPELTSVSGRIMLADDIPTTGGAIYFVLQNRIIELPHQGAEDAVRRMAEYVVKVDAGGSFSLDMAPGNYALFYDLNELKGAAEPGPDSMRKVAGYDKDRIKKRIEAIKENATKGLPIVEGIVGESMFVVENRIVRPPVTEFGEMPLGEDRSVTLLAVTEAGEPIGFPAVLNIRGMSGDVYEPHSPTVTAPGQYVFKDVYPQFYQVVATATRPKPGEGDQATTPTLKNAEFVFDGEPMLHNVTVIPASPKP